MPAQWRHEQERGRHGPRIRAAGGLVISYVLAFLGALANASGNVLNRKASRDEPAELQFRLKLFASLVHRRVWLAAVGFMTISFILASAALGTGELASVQLVIVLELPLTLIGGSWLLGSRLAARDWVSIAIMTGGVIAVLALLHPQPGPTTAIPAIQWILGAAANGGAVVVLYLAARAHPSATARTALLGLACGFSYGLTAAFTKGFADEFAVGGIGAVVTSWKLYATIGAGLISVWLLQNAYEAGPLAASQPGITLVDPVISTLWGVVVFGEQVNQGIRLALTPLALIAVAAGVFMLSRSPILHETQTGRAPDSTGPKRADLARTDS
jgi:drug/metabolite transporter (DMT)-like permease